MPTGGLRQKKFGLSLLVSLLTAAACAVVIALDEITTGNWDDIFYLHSTALYLFDVSYLKQVHADMMCYFSQDPAKSFMAFRFDVRHLYSGNYLLYSLLFGSLDAGLGVVGHQPLGKAMQYGHIIGLALVTTLLLVALTIVVWRTRGWRGILPLQMVLFSGCFFWLLYELKLYPFVPITWTIDTLPDIIKHTTAYLVYPMSHYDLLGASPRSAAMIAIVIAFVYRWAGQSVWAVAWLVLAGLFHQSYALFATCIFMATALVYNPETLRITVVRLLLGLFAVTALWRIALVAPLSHAPAEVALVGLMLLMAVLAACAWPTKLLHRLPYLTTLPSRPIIISDAVVMVAGFMAILFAAIVLNATVDANTARYYALEPPGRYLSIVRPVLYLGFGFMLVDWLASRWGAALAEQRALLASQLLAGLTLAVVVWAVAINLPQINSFPSQRPDELADAALLTVENPPREHNIYYHILCSQQQTCGDDGYLRALGPLPMCSATAAN